MKQVKDGHEERVNTKESRMEILRKKGRRDQEGTLEDRGEGGRNRQLALHTATGETNSLRIVKLGFKTFRFCSGQFRLQFFIFFQAWGPITHWEGLDRRRKNNAQWKFPEISQGVHATRRRLNCDHVCHAACTIHRLYLRHVFARST